MTKRFKRLNAFDVSLHVKEDSFIRTPREAQRNWLLNQAIGEFADDLRHLDSVASRFVPGVEATALADRTQLDLADSEIMENWQLPLMREMAAIVTEAHGDVLEIGFGIGASASEIQRRGVRSHTIIECNKYVIERFHDWKNGYPAEDIRLVAGRWQDTLDELGLYDGIFFHTYPLNEEERYTQLDHGTTFAAHFFEHAAKHLRPGGLFTYLSNEIDSMSRRHQRALLDLFSTVRIAVVRDLSLPDDVKDAWWADSMIVVGATK